VSPRSGLSAIAPRSPRHVLEELAARGARAVAGGQERPLVTLELANGRQLRGSCVAIADDGGLPMVLLHTGGIERAPEVLHVRIDHVVAVGYQAWREAAPAGPAPGRLEINRALAGVADELAAKLGQRVELTAGELAEDAQRLAAMALVPVLRQALSQLAGDAMGADALRSLSAIRVGAAREGAALRTHVGAAHELHVDAPLPPAEEWTAPALVAAIEKVM
jgi:DNA-binding transcriptional ArsR family regulator